MHVQQSSGARGPNFPQGHLTTSRMYVYEQIPFWRDNVDVHVRFNLSFRVQSGKFGRSTKFGQRPCLFHTCILIIGIKNKLTKQKVKILMRRLIMSRIMWISTVCKCTSEFT